MPDPSGSVTATVLNIQISEAENKIHRDSGLVKKKKKTDYDAKMKDIDGKYITAVDYNKFTNGILHIKVKQKELVNKSDIDKKLRN